MKDNVLKLSSKYKQDIIDLRRKIHMNPELGYKEFQTSKLVIAELEKLGIKVIAPVAETGVIGLIEGTAGKGKTIGIRADMDALALQEENDVAYKSKNDGVMHACGHDAHTAILLGVAKILVKMKDKIKGNVKLFFQPAEEGLGGALPMVKEGALKKPEVSAVISLHVIDEYNTGIVSVKDGSFTASSDRIWIDIVGKGGHAAAPHETVDPIVISSHLITALQTISSRTTNPVDSVVVTIGTIKAGSAYNIIPESAHLTGTIRALKPEVREETYKRVVQICDGLAKSFGAKILPGIKHGYSPGLNNTELNKIIVKTTKELYGEEYVTFGEEPSMGAEDFFEFSDNYRIPVAMFWLGIRNEAKGIIYPGHNPKFNVDEDALPMGSAILSLSALNYLNQ